MCVCVCFRASAFTLHPPPLSSNSPGNWTLHCLTLSCCRPHVHSAGVVRQGALRELKRREWRMCLGNESAALPPEKERERLLWLKEYFYLRHATDRAVPPRPVTNQMRTHTHTHIYTSLHRVCSYSYSIRVCPCTQRAGVRAHGHPPNIHPTPQPRAPPCVFKQVCLFTFGALRGERSRRKRRRRRW